MSATWMQTARRLLPRLASLSRRIRPTFHLDSVNGLSAGRVRDLGVEAVLWDVDGTLMAHHAGRVDPALAAGFEDLLRAPGLRHAIVSNCQEARFAELGEIFPAVPVLLGYETGAGAAFRVRRGPRASWRGPGAAAASSTGDGTPGELRPIRKPSRRLVRAALEELDIADRPEAALMVGDQYFTDIASANLAGVRSAKVPTLHRASFPAPVRWSQRLEAVLYRLKHGLPRPGGA
ncbi:MAG: HAD hydrolase-like protein [Gemmatimonadota bacterium]|uniref:HAD hydrolase-like protein n=1 Tax=Candidatus Palauibacter scopulicola TaxID=3056741 RepID=UPI0023983ACE|nr:HAD hydrolase-like protein [Candidatus Palauibacter scopulicola]MDE2664143.1 HAD hydrolase-like protein [Candidatus Palauibacter scopulicola]